MGRGLSRHLFAGLRDGLRNLPVRAADALTCAVLGAVCLAPVALLAHLILDKPARLAECGAGFRATELGAIRHCDVASWSLTCLIPSEWL